MKSVPFRKPIMTWRRPARGNAVRVSALCGMFGALVLATVFYVREPATTTGSSNGCTSVIPWSASS